jgi:hypothetical protein
VLALQAVGVDLSATRSDRLSRTALASVAKVRLQLAHSRITNCSSADIEREADSAVKDLLEFAAPAYPTAPAELMSAIARSLLVDALSRRRGRQA